MTISNNFKWVVFLALSLTSASQFAGAMSCHNAHQDQTFPSPIEFLTSTSRSHQVFAKKVDALVKLIDTQKIDVHWRKKTERINSPDLDASGKIMIHLNEDLLTLPNPMAAAVKIYALIAGDIAITRSPNFSSPVSAQDKDDFVRSFAARRLENSLASLKVRLEIFSWAMISKLLTSEMLLPHITESLSIYNQPQLPDETKDQRLLMKISQSPSIFGEPNHRFSHDSNELAEIAWTQSHHQEAHAE